MVVLSKFRVSIKILKTSKEETGIQFFSPAATTVEKFSSIILPSDTTVSELQKLASDHKAEVTIKHESSSGMWINILVSVVPFAHFILLPIFYDGKYGRK